MHYGKVQRWVRRLAMLPFAPERMGHSWAKVHVRELGFLEPRRLLSGTPFQVQPPLVSGTAASCVDVADFNADGNLDLVVAYFKGDPETHTGLVEEVLLGNGDGTFRKPIPLGQQVTWWSFAAGDFNGDGKIDLAAAGGYSESTLTILLGNGDGTFGQKIQTPWDYNCYSISAGDFNGDGKADLAETFETDVVSVFLGNGDGTFGSRWDYFDDDGEVYAVAVGDYDGDGRDDIAYAIDGGIRVALGRGDGTFDEMTEYRLIGAGADYGRITGVTAGDFNGDGKLDLAAGAREDSVGVMLGHGDGTFDGPRVIPFQSGKGNLTWIASGDFNKDGLEDLVITDWTRQTLRVIRSQGGIEHIRAVHIYGYDSDQPDPEPQPQPDPLPDPQPVPEQPTSDSVPFDTANASPPWRQESVSSELLHDAADDNIMDQEQEGEDLLDLPWSNVVVEEPPLPAAVTESTRQHDTGTSLSAFKLEDHSTGRAEDTIKGKTRHTVSKDDFASPALLDWWSEQSVAI